MAFCVAFAFQGTFTYLPFRLAVAPFHFSNTVIALMYLTYTVGMVSSSLAGRFHGRLGLRGGLVLGFVLTIAGNALSLTTSTFSRAGREGPPGPVSSGPRRSPCAPGSESPRPRSFASVDRRHHLPPSKVTPRPIPRVMPA